MISYPYAVTLIIPLYNESERIEEGLKKALRYLPRTSYRTELILVDDGSKDDTTQKATEMLKAYKHAKILSHSKNKGKGAAIKTGVKAASGKYVVFSDIDFSTPITEIVKLIDGLKVSDIVIGVRRDKKSLILKHQPKLRELLGQVFTKISNNLVTPGIVDATCGFKGFRNEVARDIFKRSRIERWAFDSEILFLAQKLDYSIRQVPVSWAHTEGTKVNMLIDGVQALSDIFKIRSNWSRGVYGSALQNRSK